MTQELTVQPTLSPEVFGRFINLSVGVSLAGSTTYSLDDLEKVMGGEQLQKGSELVITARYFVADMNMPVKRENGYGSQEGSYRLDNAKLALKLIKVESIDVKAANLHQCQVMKCECLVENVPNTERPAGYRVAEAPLKGFWAKSECPECRGKGYVHPRKSKAPYANRVWGSGVLVLVDEFPELPDVPEGHCLQCGEERWHVQGCPVKAEEEAAAKKAAQEAKDAYKAETGKKAPKCYGDFNQYRLDCQQCEAAEQCKVASGFEGPTEGTDDERPACFGEVQDYCSAQDCDSYDACVDASDGEPTADPDTDSE